MKLHLKIIRTSETTIECKQFTCHPCTHLHTRLASSWEPGKASCDLFGDLKWPKTMGEIERLPECLKLDQPNATYQKADMQILIVGLEKGD